MVARRIAVVMNLEMAPSALADGGEKRSGQRGMP
jgi:hypothetical protein